MREEKRKSILASLIDNNKGSVQNQSVFRQKQNKNNQNSNSNPLRNLNLLHLDSGIKRIGTKPSIKSFNVNLNQNKLSSRRPSQEQKKVIALTKAKSTNQCMQNMNEVRKKLKRVGKKVWVTAYKQSVELQQNNLKSAEVDKKNLLNVNSVQSPSEIDYFSQFRQQSRLGTPKSSNSRVVELSDREVSNIDVNDQISNHYNNQNNFGNQDNLRSQKQLTNQYSINIFKQPNLRAKQGFEQRIDQQYEPFRQIKKKQEKKQTQTERIERIERQLQKINKFQIPQSQKEQLDLNIQQLVQQIQNYHNQKNQIKISRKVIKNDSKNAKAKQTQKRLSTKFTQSKKYILIRQNKNEMEKEQIKLMDAQQQEPSVSMKSSKKPLLPAYPFIQQNNIKQTEKNMTFSQKARSYQSSLQNLNLKKQSSCNSMHNSRKIKFQQSQYKQQSKQPCQPMLQSLSHSTHKKQSPIFRILEKKQKKMQVNESPKTQGSNIKKSIKQFQINKYILQAKKQVFKENYQL